MNDELRVWLKSFDIKLDSHDKRLERIELSTSTMNREMGECVVEIQGLNKRFDDLPTNGKVNPTVALLIRWVVMPLIVILGSLYGVSNIFGG